MAKIVNIYSKVPIRALDVSIRGNIKGLELSDADIFKCICQKGIVDEVLSDGSLIRLDLSNYNKDNEAALKAKAQAILDAAAKVQQDILDKAAAAKAAEVAAQAEQQRLAKEAAAKAATDFATQEQTKIAQAQAIAKAAAANATTAAAATTTTK